MSRLMHIGKHTIGEGNPCFIIAEAGVNHNGNLKMAKRLIDAAHNARVDAVKFQSFKTENIIIEGVKKVSYQKRTTSANESQGAMLKRLEIDKGFHLELLKYCKKKKIMFLSTCTEEDSLNLLLELDVPALKIASMDTVNPLLLEKAAKSRKPVILSTGMSSQAEIEFACKCLRKNGCKELALLKCTSNYPTSLDNVHLKAMLTMQNEFDAIIGFSDHTEGLGASPYAVALGAKIVEKHFTLDKNLKGPDHKASLSPQELILLVKEIRRVEKMLGAAEIRPTASERETSRALRKSLVLKVDLKKGDTLTRLNMTTKRTGGLGIPSIEFYDVLGQVLASDISKDRPIHWSNLVK